MIILCDKCKRSFDDEFRDTICPHETFAANDGKNNFAHHPNSYLSPLPGGGWKVPEGVDTNTKYGVQDSLSLDTGEGRKIGTHIYTVMGPSRPCGFLCPFWCFLNLHRWAYPGGYCECCGTEDTFV